MNHDQFTEFLSSLEEEFINNRPFTLNIGDDDKLDANSTRMSSWNDVIREHMENKPQLSQSEHSIPRSNSISIMRNEKFPISAHKPKSLDFDKSAVLRKHKLEAYRESRSLATICKSGWNLSKGWKNRPKMFTPDMNNISQDIKKYSNRIRNETSRRSNIVDNDDVIPSLSSNHEHRNTYLFNDSNPIVNSTNISKMPSSPSEFNTVNHLKTVIVSLQNDQSLGPRYNLRDKSYDLKIQSNIQDQSFDTRAKNISFGIGDRPIQPLTASPGPIYNISNDYLKAREKPSPKLYAGGREFFGSIYMDVYSQASPGPIYNVSEAHDKLAYVGGVHGTVFGPALAVTKQMPRQIIPEIHNTKSR